jgi:DNA-binding Lrp family transcriptional regulator
VLTARDREIVRWVGRHGVVGVEHVMKRLSIGRTAAYRRIHELVDSGLIRRHRVLYTDGGLLVATVDGLRWAGLDRLGPPRISLALVPHMIVSAALAAELEPRIADATLLSDREHRAAENASGRPIASGILGPARDCHPRLHRPDFALLDERAGGVVAIEVELTLKTKARLERILRGYVRNRNVTAVRYYGSPSIGDAVRRAARAVGADRLLELAPLPATSVRINGSRR